MNDHDRLIRLESLLAGQERALKLQAKEYERRLADLNHEHARVRSVQSEGVTSEKFDDYAKSEQEKVQLALDRVNEKFDDYIKRYEQRQREVDMAIANQKASADTANAVLKAAAEQAQRIAEEQGRRSNRNIAIATLVIGVLVAFFNLLPL